jgi:hypothetical protein
MDGSEKAALVAWQGPGCPLFNEVMEVLEGHRWIDINLLHRGLEDDPKKCPVTVVIMSPTAGEDVWWDTLVPELERRVQAVLPEVEVELLYGEGLSW